MQSKEGGREGVEVIVLAGAVGLDAPWARGIPRALLPLPISPLIESTLDTFHNVFDCTCTICVNGQVEPLVKRLGTLRVNSDAPTLRVRVDHVPRGTAGCIKACESHLQGDVMFVAGASVWLDDDLRWMLEQHRADRNALTVYCTHQPYTERRNGRRRLVPAGIYCCDRSVLGYIPPKGYFDLKEQLVPALRKAGLRVGAVLLPGQTCEVLNWPTYMRLLSDALSREQIATEGYVQLAPGIWSGEDVRITPHARIVGPALLGHRCTIEDGATIVGPAVLGEGCHVAEGAWVIRTAASAGASIGRNACVSDAIVPAGQPGLRPSSTIGERETLPAGTRASDVQATPAFKKLMVRMPIPILMFGAFVWAFSHIIERLWQVWQSNPDYSVGQLVPLAALYMIWMNRSRLNGVTLQPSMGGVAALACGVAVCTIGAYFLYFSLEGVGMVVCANAIVWALVGWGGYKRLGAPLLFLFLMLPLPGQVHNAVMLPLQSFCARVSATVLETAGVPVVRYGHILEVAGRQTAVAEACNGLRMAMAFLIVTAVVAYVINRPLWQKIIVVFSSIPIALGCNVARIVAMAYSYGAGYEWLVEGPLHTGTGLLMMPLALALVMLELAVLSNLTTPAAWDKDSRSVAAIPVASGT